MANGDTIEAKGWTLILPVSALALLGTLLLAVAKDASIALDVARQHGQELLLLRGEMVAMQAEINEKTRSRYTAEDAERDLSHMREDIRECKDALKIHDTEHRNDR